METAEDLVAIKKIKETHSKLTTYLGVAIGLVLVVYFFTFATVLDKAPPSVFQFQAVSSVVLVIMLFYLKRLGFALTRLRYGRRAPYNRILPHLGARDMERTAEEIHDKVFPRKPS